MISKNDLSGGVALPVDPQALEARYGLRVAARLSEQADALPHDLGERLRFARERALERARQSRGAPAVVGNGRGTLTFGGGGAWWWRLASLAPVIALVAGLVLIQQQSEAEQAQLVADIDAALLSDDLPPAAYADAGFAEFLRLQRD